MNTFEVAMNENNNHSGVISGFAGKGGDDMSGERHASGGGRG